MSDVIIIANEDEVIEVAANIVEAIAITETVQTVTISEVGERGLQGIAGQDGREVQLRATGTHIQWKYEDEITWTDIVALSAITGPQGLQGVQGVSGTNGSDGADGTDGKEIELQKTATHVQWRYVDESWINLIALTEIKGNTGDQGIQGETGAQGPQGEQGEPGATTLAGITDIDLPIIGKRGVSPKKGIEFFTHCLNTGNDGPIVVSNSGTGSTNVQNNVSGNRQGILGHFTGTTTNGRAYAQTSPLSFAFGGGAWYLEGDIKTTSILSNATDTYQIIYGFADTNSAANQVDGVFFLYDSEGISTGSAVSGNWQLVTSANSIRTFTTSSVAVAINTWYRLRIEINAAGTSASFYINDTLAGTITTNIPTGSSRVTGYLCMIIKSAGTNSRSMDHDWSYGYNTFTTPL